MTETNTQLIMYEEPEQKYHNLEIPYGAGMKEQDRVRRNDALLERSFKGFKSNLKCDKNGRNKEYQKAIAEVTLALYLSNHPISNKADFLDNMKNKAKNILNEFGTAKKTENTILKFRYEHLIENYKKLGEYGEGHSRIIKLEKERHKQMLIKRYLKRQYNRAHQLMNYVEEEIESQNFLKYDAPRKLLYETDQKEIKKDIKQEECNIKRTLEGMLAEHKEKEVKMKELSFFFKTPEKKNKRLKPVN